ncbi:AraC family transcriptional regulator [Herbaspirillum seropedicae]|uniref:AraC family transcription regulator protein n=1 Tax=Herbaspirillum seropedicae (strain SmR1) TaxID=757424 RepID=D8IVH1_HERSS|nr:AraC family transcriptional regulator [Herbaspirillum seropedicae]ADJ63910.1 AraC family transcription regulator protein [Herbaspirillum seropedicae SmR1]AKN65895.1 AraC family transcriptional regulator [Herbaspirillum seropedicae]NQE29045.1 AraC family transcriptional regulator [Herbaspirillum seropedicae]UMU21872.1 AraC family transcriptional regulator [Herbaspirillum seropedicae]
MSDPLSEVVRLLRPQAVFANLISGKGNWAVRYSEFGKPSFCIMLEGSCRLAVDEQEPTTLSAGDFVLLPTTPGFTISSFVPAPPVHLDPNKVPEGLELRYGEQTGQPDMRSLGGSFEFGCADPSLLVSLLPKVVHVQGSTRLSQLVQMVGEEASGGKPGSEFMLSRLAEMLLVEAMRSSTSTSAPPGLLRGLGDERLAVALKHMHARIEQRWSVAQLARIAALSRSSFFERFTRTLGVAPMAYLLAWRMEIARELLRRGELSVSEIAERTGYGSTSAFSVAFTRQVGQPPGLYALYASAERKRA